MRIFETLVISISLLFVSCESNFLPELDIINCYYDAEKITVEFSRAPNSISVQNSFSLTEDKIEVSGIYIFTGSTVLFYPNNGIRENYDYVFTIANNCEDKNGISIKDKYVNSFTTRKELNPPEILSISPADNGKLSIDDNYMEIFFSEPIDKNSFKSALSIIPSFNYILEFNDNNDAVKIIPTDKLQVNTDYKITISRTLMDTSRNFILDDFLFSFYVNKNFENPTLSATIINSNNYSKSIKNNEKIDHIPLNSEVLISFSTEMNLTSLSSCISLTPSLPFTLTKDELNSKWCKISFSKITWGSEYTLNISKKLSDKFSNNISHDITYRFEFNSDSDKPPEFIEGYIQTGIWTDGTISKDDYKLISKDTNYEYIIYDPTYFLDNKDVNADLYLVFSSSKESAGINIYSLMDKFSISVSNSNSTYVIKKISKLGSTTLDTYPIKEMCTSNVKDTGLIISVFKYELEISNSTKNGIISFQIDSGIKDNLGNESVDTYIYKYNK